MLEETCIIRQLTVETQKRLDVATEKQCKIVFEEDKIVVPTCLVILPYELIFDDNRNLVVPKDKLHLAIEVGKHLLDINKATARLSFWLMMKKNMSGNDGHAFKAKLKNWLKRARTEHRDVVAKEIVSAINCGNEYLMLCREMLEKGDNVSQAKSYIKDPMAAAKDSIKKSTDALVKCFSPQTQFLYVVDEYAGVPILGALEGHRGRGNVDEDNVDETNVFPIEIDPNTRHLQNLFLPFVNISLMTVSAIDGINSVKSFLGLPTSHPIPAEWKDSRPGLVHGWNQPTSVAEFAVLQDVVRKQETTTTIHATPNNVSGRRLQQLGKYYDSERTGISIWSETSFEDGSELRRLEVFFREYDPMRMFSGMTRVTNKIIHGSAIWTTEETVKKMQRDVELASVEKKLQDCKTKLDNYASVKDDIKTLGKQYRLLRKIGRKDKEKARDRPMDSPMDSDPNLFVNGTQSPTAQPAVSAISIISTNPEPPDPPPVISPSELPPEGRRQRLERKASKKKKSKYRFRPYFKPC